MSKWQYTKGLHDLGHDCFAYLQPDGSWGWSNAGLVRDGDQSLLVDTLFDLPLTAHMLKTMRDAVCSAPCAIQIIAAILFGHRVCARKHPK
jgi:cyclase